MRAMTSAHLRSAFGGESMAHMRYMLWREKARQEGFPNVARLFDAISAAEHVHAGNHFTVLQACCGPFDVTAGGGFGLGSTSENLQGAYEGEMHEVEEMYPVYLEAARQQGEKEALKSFHYALSAEKIHAAMYAQAKAVVDKGKDIELQTVYVCPTCGFTHEGDSPDKCPICAATKDTFLSFA